jgi:pimeloyl-ACP methyl ester carboxylesterase
MFIMFKKLRLIPLMTLIAVSMLAAGCVQSPLQSNRTNKPQTYVLVHGAFEDGSVWSAVRRGLEQAGQKVIIVNLPGRSGDTTPIDQISLDLYRTAVESKIATSDGPVILVGHSFGGITISNVAEMHPEKIKTLVYLAALLPKDGDSLQSLSQQDKAHGFTQENFLISTDQKYASVLARDQLSLFCAECTPAQATKIDGKLIPEPLAPMRTRVHITKERFGKVDKVYIATDLDRVISPTAQESMLAATPTRKVVHLKTSHTPFLSKPDELVQVLLSIEK